MVQEILDRVVGSQMRALASVCLRLHDLARSFARRSARVRVAAAKDEANSSVSATQASGGTETRKLNLPSMVGWICSSAVFGSDPCAGVPSS